MWLLRECYSLFEVDGCEQGLVMGEVKDFGQRTMVCGVGECE